MLAACVHKLTRASPDWLQGLTLKDRSATIDGVIKALLAKLEKEKAALGPGDNDPQYCENFAITVFTRADKQDRAGRADKNTAMTYYAASIFFEVLHILMASCYVCSHELTVQL